MTDQPTDPSWDPAVRDRVRYTLDRLLYAVQEIHDRRTDRTGRYAPPGDLAEHADTTGLIAVGKNDVIRPLQEAIDQARAELFAVATDVDDYKRAALVNYRPPPRTT